MAVVLKTQRLVLREVVPQDAAFMIELVNEPAFIANIGDRGVRNLADAVAYIEARYTKSYRDFGYGLYIVEIGASGMPIGICGLVKREELEHPDIGFAYLERFRAQGFGYESAVAVVNYAREKFGFSRVHGVTAKTNQISVRLLEKLGLKYDRTISLSGYAEDSLLFSRDLKSA